MKDTVITLLERLHAYREHIAHAYHQGAIERTDENRRAVEILHQHRVLVPHRQGEYRLHSSLRRFLDVALNTERMLHGTADVGAVFARLEALVDSYVVAFHDGQQDEVDACEDEISQAVFEITDSLQTFITNLQASIETRFATVTSLAAKRRQNEFYLEATHRLVETLNGFHFSDMLERVEPFEHLDELFRVQLFDRLPVFRDALQRIYEILRQFLFEFRRIEERAQRLQRMWLFLRRNGAYEPRNWDEAPELPAWLQRASAIAHVTHPDIDHETTEEALVAIAQAIPASALKTSRKRESGTLAPEEEAPVVRITSKPHALAIKKMFREAKKGATPFSALAWAREHQNECELSEQMWLELVLDALVKGGGSGRDVPYRIIDVPRPATIYAKGNLSVRDIEVGPCTSD